MGRLRVWGSEAGRGDTRSASGFRIPGFRDVETSGVEPYQPHTVWSPLSQEVDHGEAGACEVFRVEPTGATVFPPQGHAPYAGGAQIALHSLERFYGVKRKNVVMELYFDSPKATAPYHMVAWEHMPDGKTRKFYLM